MFDTVLFDLYYKIWIFKCLYIFTCPVDFYFWISLFIQSLILTWPCTRWVNQNRVWSSVTSLILKKEFLLFSPWCYELRFIQSRCSEWTCTLALSEQKGEFITIILGAYAQAWVISSPKYIGFLSATVTKFLTRSSFRKHIF